ncbi:hypothetical protein HHK36_012619 [Tetracentron sinense]|uniref:WPP domain-containing protein n=1 Tax=Tetracentron sinense TaxID=13715 RepID=A0A835DER6_TETSI|nr:hypothetical protein HHK36_012619 [Tetracentron sinense]
MDTTAQTFQHRAFSIKLWPPSQSTRLMLVERMTKNLCTPSIFSRKYGILSNEEAEENAKQIEGAAFTTANLHYEKEPDGDGSSAVQLYAKESSKLMMEVLKKGPRNKEDGEMPIPGKDTVHHETFFDISGGTRAFIEAEEAEEILRPLKEPGNSYTKICFSNRSFGLGAAHVAEPILVSLKDQLTEVDLSDFIAGRPEAEALEVMNIFSMALEGCVLKYLNLSNNALGEKGVRAFEALLKSQSNLEGLYLMNDGISEEAARAVSELIPSTKKLRILQFHNNMTGDEGAIAISEVVKHSHALEDFRCSSTRVGSEGGVCLAEALGTCTYLKKLDLRDNMFGVDAGIALSKALSGHTGLTEVYLSYLNLEDEGATALANALKDYAPKLEVLEMAGNDITAEAAPTLAACVAAMQFLTKLNLAENELKDEGAILISKALEGHGQLEEVDLSTNSIRRAGARFLAQAVVHKPGFKLLNIDGNFISDEGIDEVKDLFKKSPAVLGPLDENDPEGVDDDKESNEENNNNEDELESKLKQLEGSYVSAESRLVSRSSQESAISMDSSLLFSPSSEKRFWSALRCRVDTLLDNQKGEMPIGRSLPDLDLPAQAQAGVGESDRAKRLREDSLLLLRGFDSIASSLSQLTGNLDTALQGTRNLAKPSLTELLHNDLEKEIFEKGKEEDDEEEENKKRLKRKFDSNESSDDQEKGNEQNLKSGMLNKARNLAVSMATKASSLARELKSIKSDLSFMQDRCNLLEEENRRLRDGFDKGLRAEEDDLVRLQLEALLAEKSRLANENANLTRENQCLHQLVEYHQVTSQDLSASYEQVVRGMCLDFSSPPPTIAEEGSDDDGGIEAPQTPRTDLFGFSTSLDKYYCEEQK